MLAAIIATSLLMAANPATEEKKLSEAAEKELKKLQGKWKAERFATRGEEYVLKKDDPDMSGEFKGRKWIFTGVEKAEVIALDTTTKPMCIDFKSLEKVRGGVVDEAIFKLENDTLTICLFQGKDKNRPTSFDVPKEMDMILMVFKRVEPSKEKDDKEFSDAAKKELKKFEGKWKAVKAVTDGNEETPMNGTDEVIVEFKGCKLLLGDKEVFEFATIDPATNPKCFDLKALMDMGQIAKDKVFEGIYKFDGDMMVLALYIGEGSKRPTQFESEKDSKVVLVTLKREKK